MEYKGKQRIDIGEIGNPSTGDILYDGGGKLNTVIDELYNTFADTRYLNNNDGITNMKLHATSYYQKKDRTYYLTSPIPMGSCHDIDTANGAITVTLPKGKVGEGCYIINSTGSLSIERPIIINSQTEDNIKGISDRLYITSPFTRVELWCIESTGGGVTWDYSVSSMFGDKSMPVNITKLIDTKETAVPLFGYTEFSSAKFLVHAEDMTGRFVKSSEILASIDHNNKQIYFTEYAVLKNTDTPDSELYNIRFYVSSNNIAYVGVTGISGRLNFTIKSIGTVKAGVSS